MKKTAAATLILICLMALGVVYVQPVKAQYQGDITINADGSVTPTTTPIQQAGNVYTFTSDVNGTITVNRNNIVLDGNGYTLICGGSTLLGPFAAITIDSLSNVTVKNFSIIGSFQELDFGIDVEASSNITLENNTITGTGSMLAINGMPTSAIKVDGGGSNIITGNNLVNNIEGLEFSDTSNNLIVGNTISGESNPYGTYTSGIGFGYASNNTICHNTFMNSNIVA